MRMTDLLQIQPKMTALIYCPYSPMPGWVSVSVDLDAGLSITENTLTLYLRCPNCGRDHTLRIEGGEMRNERWFQ